MTGVEVPPGRWLWQPPDDALDRSRIGQYLAWLRETRGISVRDYDELWTWSVTDLEAFWGSLWDYFDIQATVPPERVMGGRQMPGTAWFPGARLNYAAHIVGDRFPRDKVAIVARSQTRAPVQLTFGELSDLVAKARNGLRRLGVGPGDRVVAYLPNIPETIVAFLACASLGAVWASCAAEFGERAVLDRFAQIEPTVLLAISAYQYGDRYVDRRDQVAAVRAGLPSLRAVIEVPYGTDRLDPTEIEGLTSWDELLDADAGADASADAEPLTFEAVPFDHPLYVLFSSGTTGLPKAIVHGHGGILVEHLKNSVLSWDLGPDDRFMWFATTAWMMWNALVSVLLTGAPIVVLDGNPLHPGLDNQWALAEETGTTVLGLNPAYIMACRKADLTPARDHDLSRLRQVCSAGSPLPSEGATWVVDQLGPRVMLNNGSGGTDVCTGIVQGNPLVPVWAGEISARCLGVKSAAFDEEGRVVVGELGELVITEPMPSMPVGFWGDADGSRYRAAYFEHYPGVWRQGDWVRFSERGSCVITGRSDATLNRGGVRLGTGELYAVVEELDEVTDSLVVHLEDPEGGPGELVLFVVLRAVHGTTEPDGSDALDSDLRDRIVTALRSGLSPRHVPDVIVAMPAVPRSLTGKKLELPVKRILQGAPPADVASRDALADPTALDAYVAYARNR